MVRNLIMAQKQISKTCVYLVSHSLMESRAICDRFGVMAKSNMSAIKSRHDLLREGFRIEIECERPIDGKEFLRHLLKEREEELIIEESFTVVKEMKILIKMKILYSDLRKELGRRLAEMKQKGEIEESADVRVYSMSLDDAYIIISSSSM